MKTKPLVLAVGVCCAVWAGLAGGQPTPGGAGDPPGRTPAVEILCRGTMAQATEELSAFLQRNPNDNEARFALGVAQVLRGVERMAGTLYGLGLRQDAWANLPFLRLPVPPNPNPRQASADDLRAMLIAWTQDLDAARATLAKIDDPAAVKLMLPVGLIHLDLNADGRADENEALFRLMELLGGGARDLTAEQAAGFVIGLDGADIHWLTGYTHLSSGLAEVVLAHDFAPLFDSTAHLFFAAPKTPYPFLNRGPRPFDFGGFDISDVIAFVHLLSLEPTEPARMGKALTHFRSVVAESRASWKRVMAETDDDREWIPNPNQTPVIPDARVTAEMVAGWTELLDEVDALLHGRKLLPFWRGGDTGTGINLAKVFEQPRRMDLILWVQGSAAAPYLERGEVTRGVTWRRLQAIFDGNLFGYAVWFN